MSASFPIKGAHKIESIFGSASCPAFSKVVSLNFYEEGDVGYSLLLLLATTDLPKNYHLKMIFERVKSLNIRQFGGSLTQITGFAINDVSDRQLEEVKYEVIDYENSEIRFYCYSAEVLEVEEINQA